MDRSSRVPEGVFAGGARAGLSSRAARALWWGSAFLVLGVLGTSVVVEGVDHGWRLPVASVLVFVQVCALRWLGRAPVIVLAAVAVTGLGVWALLPAVTLTGALLAAQVALCVVSATGPRRVAAGALAAMFLAAPPAFGAGGPAGLAVYLLAVVLAWTAGQWRRAQQARMRAELHRVVMEERARIAREVHDVVAHTLSVMVIQAGAADDVFAQQPEQARQALRAIETGARSALGELRLLLRAFRPDAEEDGAGDDGAGEQREPGPSLARLDELADTVRATGMTVNVHREDATAGLPATVDLAVYRIVQEALTNTLRHAAGADEVNVRVTAEDGCVVVTVVDNGRTPQGRGGTAQGRGRTAQGRGRTTQGGPVVAGAGAGAGAGRGLVGMTERAHLVGGSLRAGALPGGGFEVAARLPMERAS
ncbi:sensor histidine kinase [Streptomyces sp. BH-SS-21]|uniref:histidine kinase n=1 Tax=Streptomyces liliiviolaceus TaxID=2823109 RepID=A0A940Y557_9ACTN|nr:sensor histidine kinase [Streptomyces liliiviolaceus]MBQ0854763.1 sensor histidine kinase [Streptomyces liliiviolaceus]